MTDVGIDIRVGQDGSEKKQLFKNIEVTVELHQEKLAKISQDLCSVFSKTSPPFIVIEYPQGHREDQDIFNFQAKDYESGYQSHNGKLYQFANPKNKETGKLIKNIEKQFQKITKLNNSLSLKLSLYDPLGQKEQADPLTFLDRCRLKGHCQTDPDLIFTLVEIVRRISNEFLNSPIMAFAELLEQFSFKVQQDVFYCRLESISEFPEEIKKSLRQLLDFKEWVHKSNLNSLGHSKGDIVMYISLPKLMVVRIRSDAATLSALLSVFS